MRRALPSLFVALLLTLPLACETAEGQTGSRSRGDTSSNKDSSSGVDTTPDPCANGIKDPGEGDVDCGGPCGGCPDGASCVQGADCESGICGTSYVCLGAGCGNGTQDADETGVDCGGVCPACLGEGCAEDADCATGYCKGGLCDVPTCTDGVSNGDETGVDCGGSCAQCDDGQACVADLNCVSGWCNQGFCATPGCGDGVKNQGESDVDCGGPCGGCAIGQACGGPADCLSGSCQAGACAEVAPSCDDGQLNGGESDLDCGGPCPGCSFGKVCGADADCASGLCQQGACAAPASCEDGQKNGGESDVDCGGPCMACASGKFCLEHTDCMSATCIFGVCKDPTCGDDVQNQGESDVDCGGPCAACADGGHCGGDADCLSGRCTGGICTSCSDGQKNGDESDTDCGGSCGKCSDGKHCGGAADCLSFACEGGVCCSPNACGECSATPDEVCDGKDNDCDGQTDEQGDIGSAPDCDKQAGVCAGSWSECLGTSGWGCTNHTYELHSSVFQATESLCDGKDNDCDGQVDEGLLNPCGLCGATPQEVCNGVDDDCNGQTDELDSCDACGNEPSLTTLYSISSSWGYTMHWTHWMAMLDDAAYILAYPRGNYTSTHLWRCADGEETNDWTPSIGTTGNSSIKAGGGKLHVGAVGYTGGSHYAKYYRVTASGAVEEQDDIAASSNISGQPVAVAWAQDTAWATHWTYSDGEKLRKRGSDGTWTLQATVDTDDDYGAQLEVDEAGDYYMAWSTGNWDVKSAWFRENDGSAQSLCSNTCSHPSMHKAPDDSLGLAYVKGSTVMYRTFDGSLSSEESVDGGVTANLAFSPSGVPVVVYVKGDDQLWVATRGGPGSWLTEHVLTLEDSSETISLVAVGVDSAGRYHLGIKTYTTSGGYSQDALIKYTMFCSEAAASCTPNCSGKLCGGDGCGGACGTCADGESCVDGVCEAGGGCGADPVFTCQGACGDQAPSGCYCDDACVGAGDCCADKAACCGEGE